MNIIIIFAVVIIALFVLLFITKRKFGLLGLALAAGSILSGLWVEKAGYILGMLNAPSNMYVIAFVSASIVIAPAILMIFHDGKYKTTVGRLVGSSLFTLLALAFLVEPIGRVLIPQGFGAVVYDWVASNNSAIIATCLILAIVDLWLPKHNHSHEKHHNS
ncbi:hypothetical protein CVV43_00540 [Candidatus Saccharibacteria bacterium HGW-Saccharibacteria-1]|jgi:asparagine N-glycosylation enzyme membrane subunit Stt3|nr:MAG: hypothetical protein CVV43_00540 [Candidatus Saccharibacteria bacterium HGW-Saccharibacteria-1]